MLSLSVSLSIMLLNDIKFERTTLPRCWNLEVVLISWQSTSWVSSSMASLTHIGKGGWAQEPPKILSKLYFGRISAARGQRSKPIQTKFDMYAQDRGLLLHVKQSLDWLREDAGDTKFNILLVTWSALVYLFIFIKAQNRSAGDVSNDI